jgi:hypothetical protein
MAAGGRDVNIRNKTPNEIRRTGLAALKRALGPVGMIYFLQQFDRGSGDYTTEREQLLGNPTVEDLLRELRAKKRRSRGK